MGYWVHRSREGKTLQIQKLMVSIDMASKEKQDNIKPLIVKPIINLSL